MTLTAAQARALNWLPSDGEWRTNAGRMGAALDSLFVGHWGVVEIRGEKRAGYRHVNQYRLTRKGIAFKAEWEKSRC